MSDYLETIENDKTITQLSIIELMKAYDCRDENFDNAIGVTGTFTKQLASDIHLFFVVRSWYTPEYIESLTDDEQDGIDGMLDAFDKLNDLMHTDDKILYDYDFLVSVKDLQDAMGYLLNTDNTIDDFLTKYPYLTVENIATETAHVTVIEMQLKELVKKQ